MVKFNITDIEDSLTYGVFDAFNQVILEEVETGNQLNTVRKLVNAPEEHITTIRTKDEFTRFMARYQELNGMPG